MKILLSAYACEPNKGSEPGVGWNWAIQLARNSAHDIFVITRTNNKDVIAKHKQENAAYSNLHFYYYDLPYLFLWAKRHGFSVNLYYIIWQIGVFKLAKGLNKKYQFDLVHHITFGVFRDISFLYKLKVPFVFGPVGGGEYAPDQLTKNFTKKEQIKEKIRKTANQLAFINPYTKQMMKHALLIFTKTPDTRNLFPQKIQTKIYTKLEIGICDIHETEVRKDQIGNFLYVGRFIYWKGISIVLEAFKQYTEKHDNYAKLTLIGQGENIKFIEKYVTTNNLNSNIEIISWINQEDLKKHYQSARALIYPSLHDSSGNVVLESLSFGLPVICLDCGGPACILGYDLNELIVKTKNKTKEEIVYNITHLMYKLTTSKNFYDQMKNKAIIRAKELSWTNTVDSAYNIIFQELSKR